MHKLSDHKKSLNSIFKLSKINSFLQLGLGFLGYSTYVDKVDIGFIPSLNVDNG